MNVTASLRPQVCYLASPDGNHRQTRNFLALEEHTLDDHSALPCRIPDCGHVDLASGQPRRDRGAALLGSFPGSRCRR